MIKMIIAPLLFSTLVVGIAGTGDLKTMGRIGLKAIIYFEVATTIALFLGLALVNIFKPGAGLALPLGADTQAAAAMVAEPAARLGHLPAHVSDLGHRLDGARRHPAGRRLLDRSSASRSRRSAPKGQPVLDVLESTAQAMFKFTGYVMAFAPIGVFAAIAATVGGKGLGILLTLGKLVALMYLGLALFALIVLGTRVVPDPRAVPHVRQGDPRAVPDRVHHRQLRSGAAEGARGHGALRRARRTSSASCCRPATASTSTARRCICRCASVFVAQLAGVQMTLGQQLVMMLTLMLTSKGVAGVPRAALVVLTATLTQFGLPLEGAAILLGDRSDHGHGPHRGERHGQLHRHRGRRALGRRASTIERMRAFAAGASPRRPDAHRGGRRARPARRGDRPRVSPAHETTAFARAELDITDDAAVAAAIARVEPDVILNCAGVQRRRRRRGSSDRGAEQQRVRRPRAGARGRGARRDARPLQHRFRVRRHARPRRTPKTDPPNPQSVYAASKLLGEWFARDAPRAYVLRVESLFGHDAGRRPRERAASPAS